MARDDLHRPPVQLARAGREIAREAVAMRLAQAFGLQHRQRPADDLLGPIAEHLQNGRIGEADQVALADHQHDVGRRLPQQPVALRALEHETFGEPALGDVLQRAAHAHHAAVRVAHRLADGTDPARAAIRRQVTEFGARVLVFEEGALHDGVELGPLVDGHGGAELGRRDRPLGRIALEEFVQRGGPGRQAGVDVDLPAAEPRQPLGLQQHRLGLAQVRRQFDRVPVLLLQQHALVARLQQALDHAGEVDQDRALVVAQLALPRIEHAHGAQHEAVEQHGHADVGADRPRPAHERAVDEARVPRGIADLDQLRAVQRADAEALLHRGHRGLRAHARADVLAVAGDEGDHRDLRARDDRGDAAQPIERRVGLGGQQVQRPEQVEAAGIVGGSGGVHPGGRSCGPRIAPMLVRGESVLLP